MAGLHSLHSCMSTHAIHPEHGLADDCPRCAEHAEHPLDSLDTENLRALLARINADYAPRSENEARAMQNLERTMRDAGRLTLMDWLSTP